MEVKGFLQKLQQSAVPLLAIILASAAMALFSLSDRFEIFAILDP